MYGMETTTGQELTDAAPHYLYVCTFFSYFFLYFTNGLFTTRLCVQNGNDDPPPLPMMCMMGQEPTDAVLHSDECQRAMNSHHHSAQLTMTGERLV